jgi:D-threo-aldose 1-dehydrogenase
MSIHNPLVGLSFPRIGIGTGAWGSPYPPIPQEQAVQLIRAALAPGPAFYDTAPIYAGGISEKWLGVGLAGVPRSDYILETKAGYARHETGGFRTDLSHENMLHSLEESLERMQVEQVDILHLHDPDCCLSDALDIAYPALASLRDQGLIRAVGAGMNQWQMLEEFARNADFDCFLLAGRYTLLEQQSLGFLDLCLGKGIYIFLGGIFNTGILATGAVPDARYDYRKAPKEILERVAKIEAVCTRHQVPLRSAALQFPLAHPAVKSLVVGLQSEQEYREAWDGLDTPIPLDFWHELRAAGLIDPRAPLPGSC